MKGTPIKWADDNRPEPYDFGYDDGYDGRPQKPGGLTGGALEEYTVAYGDGEKDKAAGLSRDHDRYYQEGGDD